MINIVEHNGGSVYLGATKYVIKVNTVWLCECRSRENAEIIKRALLRELACNGYIPSVVETGDFG